MDTCQGETKDSLKLEIRLRHGTRSFPMLFQVDYKCFRAGLLEWPAQFPRRLGRRGPEYRSVRASAAAHDLKRMHLEVIKPSKQFGQRYTRSMSVALS